MMDFVNGEERKKVVVGVCARSKKCESRPMQEILTRLKRHPAIEIVVFSDDIILNEPATSWPDCNSLISFYSTGFPLDKAIEYVDLRKPFVLNDLPTQYDLQDRRRVYNVLRRNGIETPRYAVYNEGDEPVDEKADSIRVDGVEFPKPFVEKPTNAEDHNIHIYYPCEAGGGSQRLFRKVGNKSSEYSTEGRIRRSGSFIYEDFKATDGTDVKVYTVGPDYAHAEARKSPALDGRVERDKQGKEIRYPVILSAKEKQMARIITLAFGQTVCGFDLLRANGKSYVCDVNGFSFVKTSQKYYDDCSHILLGLILSKVAPELYSCSPPLKQPIKWQLRDELEDKIQLRCVVGIMRHGDRTPKQKMKMEVFHEKFHELVKKYGKGEQQQIKAKSPSQLKEVLTIARYLLSQVEEGKYVTEEIYKLERLKSVLEMYGSFSGINRKVQFRYCRPKGSSYTKHRKSRGNVFGPKKDDRVLLLILKWGGELTATGCAQAESLGREFRLLYPDEEGGSGLGFLRLHSTYRHDLKIYASDEGRVQMTAAAFAKGLLALEGGLTPVLVSLVNTDKANSMLDNSNNGSPMMDRVKLKLHSLMQTKKDLEEEDRIRVAPTKTASLLSSLEAVRNPFEACKTVHKLVCSIKNKLEARVEREGLSSYECKFYHGESLILMAARWDKLARDLITKNDTFQISKIPDIYDCVKYDLLHNKRAEVHEWQKLHDIVSKFADVIVPQEYGMTETEKVEISQVICSGLLRKMRADFNHNVAQSENENRLDPSYYDGFDSPFGHIRTRLYFTSESHVHSMLNILRHGGLFPDRVNAEWECALLKLGEIPELNYMTRFVFRLYEDTTEPLESDARYFVKIQFSPGARRWEHIEVIEPSEISSENETEVSSKTRDYDGASSRRRRKVGKASLLKTVDSESDDGSSPNEFGLSIIKETPTGVARAQMRRRCQVSPRRAPSPPPRLSLTDKNQLVVERNLSYGRMMVRADRECNQECDYGSGSEQSDKSSTSGKSTSPRLRGMNPLIDLHSGVPLSQMDGLLRRIALTTEQEAALKNENEDQTGPCEDVLSSSSSSSSKS